MHYPWTFVISLEADSDIIPSIAYVNDIASNRVDEIISRVPRTSNDREMVLNPGVICQFDKFYCDRRVELMDISYPVKMERMLRPTKVAQYQ